MTARDLKRSLLPVLASLIVLALLAWAGWFGLTQMRHRDVLPPASSCTVTGDARAVELSLEQAHNAAIIVGIAAADQRLGEHGGVVAIATAYQESGLKNLDYGDRDSLGLFQQRPSQGWGTAEQVRDPWYASRAFYKQLRKVKGWRDGDINDVAQKVQRSGVPDGYRKHVEKARSVGQVLSGGKPGAITCLDREGMASDAHGMAAEIRKTYGLAATASGKTVTVKAPSSRLAWSVGSFAVASTRPFGTVAVRVGNQAWHLDPDKAQPWVSTGGSGGGTDVEITVR